MQAFYAVLPALVALVLAVAFSGIALLVMRRRSRSG